MQTLNTFPYRFHVYLFLTKGHSIGPRYNILLNWQVRQLSYRSKTKNMCYSIIIGVQNLILQFIYFFALLYDNEIRNSIYITDCTSKLKI